MPEQPTQIEQADTQETKEQQEIRQGPSFQQIMADDKNKGLFTSLVDPKDTPLLDKLKGNGTFELSDYGNIEKVRQEYLRRKERAEQAKQFFSPDLLQATAIVESDLGAAIRLMGAGGAERAQNAILSQIDSYAFQDVGNFEKFVNALDTLKQQQAEKEKRLAQVDEYTKLYSIPNDAYDQVMKINDPATKEQALKSLIRKNMNWFDRVVVSDEEVKRMAGYSDKNEEALNQSYGDIGQSMEKLTASLLIISDKNPDVKKSLSDEVRRDTPEDPPASLEDRDFILNKGYDAQWEEFRQGVTVGEKGWDELVPEEQAKQRAQFLQNAFSKQRLRGVWRAVGTFFSAVAGEFTGATLGPDKFWTEPPHNPAMA